VVQHVVALLTTFIELLEAEAERLKLGLRGLLMTAALLAVGATVAATALVVATGFLLWSYFLALEPYMYDAWAALIVGGTIWLIIGIAAWIVVSRLRKS
jgi:hypothetical protein